ncbi:uncharacterized protein KY384_003718 [Bacidia gigantensis]|uniref:uncharacterized protein n=1 Tax=Bacidia gigantensis TaxID=2732470 RepID=UPI001D053DEF|nr:uncharacterized protein KY384_003718 [Bacidia gigantensis]KAG8532081.1 hypothetical protein KY384_003718 [Bacidia gigantensis]
MSDGNKNPSIEDRIEKLQQELADARAQLKSQSSSSDIVNVENALLNNVGPFDVSKFPSHHLLHLTDTALPLGSFAFSSGLESYLGHHPPAHNAKPNTLPHFLHTSLTSVASTTLPYLIAAFRHPQRLQELDDSLDACILCPVTKRASVSQGRALVTIWERSLRAEAGNSAAKQTLRDFSIALKAPTDAKNREVELYAHFPLIYAAVCAAQDLSLHETAYTYLFNHAKAVMSAAVRASVLGPYAAQSLLASLWLRGEIEQVMAREWGREVKEAAQAVPALDVWVGRHELLYSRIFNS